MIFKIYFYQLCWVLVALQAFLWLQWAGAALQVLRLDFSLWRLLLLQGTGSLPSASVAAALGLSNCGSQALEAVALGLSCFEACWIFLDQGSNLCLLHWQAPSLPLSHQESPLSELLCNYFLLVWWTGLAFSFLTCMLNFLGNTMFSWISSLNLIIVIICFDVPVHMATSLVAQMVKHLPTMRETRV